MKHETPLTIESSARGGMRLIGLSAFVAAILASGAAQAISETNFSDDYARLVAPYFETAARRHFTGVGNYAISYRLFDQGPSSPTIVILPGRAEPARKYGELIYDLSRRGYSIAIMDLRGQGENERLTPLHDLGHIGRFEDYVSDLDAFVAEVQSVKKGSKLFLLAHSTGGAIGALYLKTHPLTFDAVVLSSPMFEINTGETSAAYAYWGSFWKVITGDGATPIDGLDRYEYNPNLSVADSMVTSSEARWSKSKDIIRDNPELSLGGASYRWLFQALTATTSIERAGKRIERPLAVLRAGRDKVLKTGKYDRFCSYRPDFCTVIPLADAEHEILQERDTIRDQAIETITNLFR